MIKQVAKRTPKPQVKDVVHPRIQAAASAAIFLLRESPLTAQKVAMAAYASKERTSQLWKSIGEENVQKTKDRIATVQAADIGRLVRFLNGDPRGVVLLTIHLGSYFLGILRLVQALQRRRFLFLRRSQTMKTSLETKAFAQIESLGIEFSVVHSGIRGVHQIARGLRDGAIVVMLYDLPSAWGSTIAVDLLGTTVNWVRGPYFLASRSNAWMVPFFCIEKAEQHTLVIGRLSEFSSEHSRNLERLPSVAQRFVDAASQAIRAYPEQWHHWNLMGEMTQDSKTPPKERTFEQAL